MLKAVGVVTRTSEKMRNTRNGQLPVFSVMLEDNTWYDFGFKNPNLSNGDSVSLEYEESQWGKKVKSHIKQGVSSVSPTPGPSNTSNMSGSMDRQKSIVRQTCLKVSGEVVSALIQKGHILKADDPIDTLLRIARGIEGYALVQEPEDDPDFDQAKRKEALESLVSGVEADTDE